MTGRTKFQVWSDKKQRWRTAYVLSDLIVRNVTLFRSYGYSVRWWK